MVTEKQFNQLWETVKSIYVTEQSILAKDCCYGKDKLIQRRILHRSGNVTYDVDIESSVSVRHTNQLQSSYLLETKSNFTSPLDILLDTFELPPQNSRDIPKDNPKTTPKQVSRKS